MLNITNSNITIEDNLLFSKRLASKTLKDGMLIYENRELHSKIPVNRPFIIRLNCNSYNKMNQLLNTTESYNTNNMFNQSFVLSMIKTTKHLLNDVMFKPYLVYTKGNEIIILFNKSYNFNHSTQKYLSILASKATNYFHNCFYTYLTSDDIMEHYSYKTISKILDASPVFESHLVFFPEDKNYEIVNYFIWRNTQINSLQDCLQSLYGNQITFKKTNKRLAEIFNDNSYFNNNSYLNIYMSYGVFMKQSLSLSKIYFSKEIDDKTIFKNETNMWSMLFKYNDEILNEMLSKYYDEDKWLSIFKASVNTWQIYELSIFEFKKNDSNINLDDNDIDIQETNEENEENNKKIETFTIGYKFIPLFAVVFSVLNHLIFKSDLKLDYQMLTQSCLSVIYCCIMKCIFVQYNFTFIFMCNFDKLCYLWFSLVGIISALGIITNNYVNPLYITLFILITLKFSFMIIYSIFGYVEIVDFINDFNLQLTTINGVDYEETDEMEEKSEKPKLINDSDSSDSNDSNDEELEKIAENIQKENLQPQMN